MNTKQYFSEHEHWMTERAKRIYEAAPSEFALVTRTQTRMVHVVTGECLYQSFGEMDTSALDVPDCLMVGYDNPNAESAMNNQKQFERLDDDVICDVEWDYMGWYAPCVGYHGFDPIKPVVTLISAHEELGDCWLDDAGEIQYDAGNNVIGNWDSALGWSQQMGLGAPVFLDVKRDWLLKSEIVSLQS